MEILNFKRKSNTYIFFSYTKNKPISNILVQLLIKYSERKSWHFKSYVYIQFVNYTLEFNIQCIAFDILTFSFIYILHFLLVLHLSTFRRKSRLKKKCQSFQQCVILYHAFLSFLLVRAALCVIKNVVRVFEKRKKKQRKKRRTAMHGWCFLITTGRRQNYIHKKKQLIYYIILSIWWWYYKNRRNLFFIIQFSRFTFAK